MKTTKPIDVFIVFSDSNKADLDSFLKHLRGSDFGGDIAAWHHGLIEVGQHRDKTIGEKLAQAEIIALLISSDFFASKDCTTLLERAMARHTKNEVTIIPVIVRDCSWEHAPFSELGVLPDDRRSVDKWHPSTSAWRNIAEGIHGVAKERRPGEIKQTETSGGERLCAEGRGSSGSDSIEVILYEKVIVYPPDGTRHELPYDLPEDANDFKHDILGTAKHWKRVHTISERVYDAFHEVRDKMTDLDLETDDARVYEAGRILSQSKRTIENWHKQLISLPPEFLRQAQCLELLMSVTSCIQPILRVFAGGTPNQIKNARELLKVICRLCFQTLSCADLLLEDYFSKISSQVSK